MMFFNRFWTVFSVLKVKVNFISKNLMVLAVLLEKVVNPNLKIKFFLFFFEWSIVKSINTNYIKTSF
jgi:hypothetical protein